MRLGSSGGGKKSWGRGGLEADRRGAYRTSPDRTVNQGADAQGTMSTSNAHCERRAQGESWAKEREW